MKLHFEETGLGVPVFLVHGFPLDHTIWKPVVATLAGSVRVILPDLRGHGHSPVPPGVYPMSIMADNLLELADDLEIDRAIWIGHSMGGYVCLALTANAPGRVAGLGLVASHPLADSPEKRQGRLTNAQAVLSGEQEKVLQGSVASLSDDEVVCQRSLEIMRRTDPRGMVGAMLGMAERPDSSAMLANLDVPLLVLAGEQDRILPLETARAASALARRSLWRPLADCGHMPMLEAPEKVAAAVRDLITAAGS